MYTVDDKQLTNIYFVQDDKNNKSYFKNFI
jgi:hypothetical protein